MNTTKPLIALYRFTTTDGVQGFQLQAAASITLDDVDAMLARLHRLRSHMVLNELKPIMEPGERKLILNAATKKL